MNEMNYVNIHGIYRFVRWSVPMPLYLEAVLWEKPLIELRSSADSWYGGRNLISVCISARLIFVERERGLLYRCLVFWMKLSVINTKVGQQRDKLSHNH